MDNLGSDPQGSGQGLYISSARANAALGARMVDPDTGRVFRYCKAGDTALVAGNWIQSPAEVGNHQNIAVITGALGATTITATLGATAATANQYAGGFAVVTVTPGLGQAFVIKSHAAVLSGGVITLELASPIRVVLSTSTRLDLVPNPYNGVIQNPVTTLTGTCVGVAPYVIAASEYGWLLTRGIGAALTAGTVGPGLALVVPGTAAGAAVIDGAASATPIVGHVAATTASGETNAVMVMLE
jgi:hypothetical protein